MIAHHFAHPSRFFPNTNVSNRRRTHNLPALNGDFKVIAKKGSVVIAVEGQRGDEGRRHWFDLVVASQGLDFLAKRLVLILGMRLLLSRPVK